MQIQDMTPPVRLSIVHCSFRSQVYTSKRRDKYPDCNTLDMMNLQSRSQGGSLALRVEALAAELAAEARRRAEAEACIAEFAQYNTAVIEQAQVRHPSNWLSWNLHHRLTHLGNSDGGWQHDRYRRRCSASCMAMPLVYCLRQHGAIALRGFRQRAVALPVSEPVFEPRSRGII